MATTNTIQGFFGRVVRETVNLSMREQPDEHQNVLQVRTSTDFKETDISFATLGLPQRKAELAAIQFDDIIAGNIREYFHEVSAIGFKASFEVQEDDRFGMVSAGASSLGDSLREGYQIDFANVWNNAFTGDGNPILVFDGLSIINASHTRLDAGATQSNLGTGDVSLNLFQTARYHFRNLRNDRGLRDLGHKINRIIIAPDAATEPVVDQILGAAMQPFTTDTSTPHELGAVKSGMQKVIYSYMTDTDRTIILSQRALSKKGGPFAQWRRRVSMANWDDDSIQGTCFVGSYRNSWGCSEWRGTFGSTGV